MKIILTYDQLIHAVSKVGKIKYPITFSNKSLVLKWDDYVQNIYPKRYLK